MAPLFTGLKLGFGSGAGEKSIVTTIYTLDGSWTYLGALEPTWTTQSIPVPADTTSVKITADGGSSGPGVSGGYAGFAEATFTTLAGKTLNATIRGGGGGGLFFGNPYPNGRHFAGVFDGPVIQSNSLVIAGGGGGPASGQHFSPNFLGPGPSGAGNGGGPAGVIGQFGKHPDYSNVPDGISPPTTGGTGGTQSSGGAGGYGNFGPNGSPGSALQGGTGGESPEYRTGAGGGGGYYGGGGGSAGVSSPYSGITPAGGGGGSGYIHPSGTLTTNSTGTSTLTNTGRVVVTVTELK
jgi:hypothetical protein